MLFKLLHIPNCYISETDSQPHLNTVANALQSPFMWCNVNPQDKLTLQKVELNPSCTSETLISIPKRIHRITKNSTYKESFIFNLRMQDAVFIYPSAGILPKSDQPLLLLVLKELMAPGYLSQKYPGWAGLQDHPIQTPTWLGLTARLERCKNPGMKTNQIKLYTHQPKTPPSYSFTNYTTLILPEVCSWKPWEPRNTCTALKIYVLIMVSVFPPPSSRVL